ncbi:MAG: TIR domain-containing protein [Neisseriaceae bacterium]|nr:TIR domain-containing protein [Neisseriaceae bacterium]
MITTGFVSQNQPQRHNVFVSYHHDNDQYWRDRFENLFVNHDDIMVSKSVQIGDIPENTPTDRIRQIIRDNYLRDSTVTVVLIGTETWKRKHVDWEIGSSIRHTQYNSRSGLLGIILPPFGNSQPDISREYNTTNDNELWYYPHSTIPPRLYDNVKCGFAKIYKWSEDPFTVQQWIHEAFLRRDKYPYPDNSRESFKNNRSGDRWY